jgi:hypothetical protein
LFLLIFPFPPISKGLLVFSKEMGKSGLEVGGKSEKNKSVEIHDGKILMDGDGERLWGGG